MAFSSEEGGQCPFRFVLLMDLWPVPWRFKIQPFLVHLKELLFPTVVPQTSMCVFFLGGRGWGDEVDIYFWDDMSKDSVIISYVYTSG